eukprot:5526479-Amphidinium_carterae.2
MAFQVYQKQKNYQKEYDLLLDKCAKLEEDLAQAKRDVKIWTEHSRAQEMKVIGLQRTVSSNHARLTALEQSTAALRANATATQRIALMSDFRDWTSKLPWLTIYLAVILRPYCEQMKKLTRGKKLKSTAAWDGTMSCPTDLQ